MASERQWLIIIVQVNPAPSAVPALAVNHRRSSASKVVDTVLFAIPVFTAPVVQGKDDGFLQDNVLTRCFRQGTNMNITSFESLISSLIFVYC